MELYALHFAARDLLGQFEWHNLSDPFDISARSVIDEPASAVYYRAVLVSESQVSWLEFLMARPFPECLRVMAEYGSSGIWVVKPFGPFRHGMIGHKKLGLPEDLARGFREWIDKYWRVLDAPAQFDSVAFNQEGRRLAQELKVFVGSETEVLFAPIGPDNSLEVEEQVS